MSSLRRGHANLLCIVPILTDDPRRESNGRAPSNGRQRAYLPILAKSGVCQRGACTRCSTAVLQQHLRFAAASGFCRKPTAPTEPTKHAAHGCCKPRSTQVRSSTSMLLQNLQTCNTWVLQPRPGLAEAARCCPTRREPRFCGKPCTPHALLRTLGTQQQHQPLQTYGLQQRIGAASKQHRGITAAPTFCSIIWVLSHDYCTHRPHKTRSTWVLQQTAGLTQNKQHIGSQQHLRVAAKPANLQPLGVAATPPDCSNRSVLPQAPRTKQHPGLAANHRCCVQGMMLERAATATRRSVAPWPMQTGERN